MKIIVVGLLIAIIYTLISSVVYLVKEGGSPSKRTMHALTFRVGLSVFLFILLLVGYALGWIAPHHPGF